MTLDRLRTALEEEDVDVRHLKTLREVATQNDDDLASLPETEVERQFPVYTLETTPEVALSLWEQLRELTDKTGYYPVILGDRDEVAHIWEHGEFPKLPHEYLEEAQAHDAQRWLDEEWKYNWSEKTGNKILSREWDEKAGPWLSLKPKEDIFWFLDPHVQYIGLLATTESWQCPAYLPFGDFNDCRRASFHVCIHRYWQSKYKSEIIVMTHDTIICRVDAPVTTREAALPLAIEQTAYCSDSVGVITLGQLASGLLNSRYWCFWWD